MTGGVVFGGGVEWEKFGSWGEGSQKRSRYLFPRVWREGIIVYLKRDEDRYGLVGSEPRANHVWV